MKLTEAKLKQMILEAIKNSKFKNFGVLDPDEKLRAKLGDEMFDKIQRQSPEQAEIFKQSYDPNYPRTTKKENIEDIVGQFGYKEALPFNPKDDFVSRWFRRGEGPYYIFNFYYSFNYTDVTNPEADSRRYPRSIGYGFKLKKDSKVLFSKEDAIAVPKMFDYDFTDAQERQVIESLIIEKEKAYILFTLRNY